jgi:acetyltransferase-like isoleucine patch superfamily enzyme
LEEQVKLLSKIFLEIYKYFRPINYYRKVGAKIGDDCRFCGKVDLGSEPYLVSLGDRVSITESNFITHDGAVWVFREEFPEIDIFAPIKVGNNVFIGLGCTVLPGVEIGDNVVIGAGSVVTKSLPANSVYAGIPVRKIKDISEYKEGILPRCVHTKNMGAAEKRRFLEEKFQIG